MPTLNFKGKSFVHNHHLAVKYHQLVPRKDKSLTDKVSLHDNLIVQGDNLKALKALLPTYAGKVKCIYIDPPYNTGNEGWAYNDNVNSPMMKDWLGKVVDKDDLTRHDKWLCMMMPRLKLLRELLAEDGAIFISIDDNEQHNLRVLLDEIFGEHNFVSVLPRITKKAGKTTNEIAKNTDYLVVYKNSEEIELNGTDVEDEGYKHSDEYVEERGLYKLSQTLDYSSIQYSKSLDYEIELDGEIFRPGGVEKNEMIERQNRNPKSDFCWRWSRKLFDFGLDNGFIVVKSSKNGKRIYTKTYANAKIKTVNGEYVIENVKRQKSVTTLEFTDNKYSNDNSKKELEKIFGNKVFEYSKPSSLVKKIIQLFVNENDIILDSFAGSGTTAHAVLDLNKEDGGNRKFILVEMEDYANTITAERVRRVINGVPTSKNFKEGTGGTFSYFELGPPIEMENILRGDKLPSYEEFAKYLFYTATGEEFDNSVVSDKLKSGKLISEDENFKFIGESKEYEVFLIYKPDIEYLKSTALTLDRAKSLGKHPPAGRAGNGKKRLVFAPAKFVDNHTLTDLRIEFSQLPFEIYKLKS